MSMPDLITAMYPEAIAGQDYIVKDDGYGPYLTKWAISGPLPEGETMGITAVQAFAELHGTMRADAQALLRKADAINDLLTANPQVAALAATAEPGTVVGNTGMVREEVLMGIALIASFRAYAETYIATGITVRNAVYRLG
jgi:hypothetical protein